MCLQGLRGTRAASPHIRCTVLAAVCQLCLPRASRGGGAALLLAPRGSALRAVGRLLPPGAQCRPTAKCSESSRGPSTVAARASSSDHLGLDSELAVVRCQLCFCFPFQNLGSCW